MILLTQGRSGSEWFLKGLTDITYGGWEIFGDLDRIVGTDFTMFQNISFETRLNMLRCTPKNRAHKILAANLKRERDAGREEQILEILKSRDDVYVLYRKDSFAVLRSWMLGRFNGLNFHGDSSRLQVPFTVPKDLAIKWIDLLCNEIHRIRKVLPVRETFVYEDLVSGVVPQTVNWNKTSSPVKQRNSENYEHLILNIDELREWVNEYADAS